MPAVRADEVDGPVGPFAHRAVPGRGQQVGVRRPDRPPQPLPAGPAVGVGPAAAGVGQPLAGAADQQQPHVLRPGPPGQQRGDRLVEARLGQRVASPRAGLLDEQPALGRGGGGDGGVAAGQRPHGAAAVVQPADGRAGRSVRTTSSAGGSARSRPGGRRPGTTATDSVTSRRASVSRSAGSRPGRSPTLSSPAASRAASAARTSPGKEWERRPASRVTRPSVAVAERAAQPRAQAQHGVGGERGGRGRLGQRGDRLGAHLRPGRRAQPVGHLGRVDPAEPLAAGPAITAATSSADGVRVGEVEAEREGAPQRRVLGGERAHEVQRRLGGRPPGHRVDADGQVGADLAERRRRVQVAAGQVERVAGAQHGVDHRLALGGGGDLRACGRSRAGCAAGRAAPARGWSSASRRPPAARTRRGRRSGRRTRARTAG